MEFGLAYLGIGFALFFGAITFYLLSLAGRQKALEKRLEAIKSEPSKKT